jgi:hypothetical protein
VLNVNNRTGGRLLRATETKRRAAEISELFFGELPVMQGCEDQKGFLVLDLCASLSGKPFWESRTLPTTQIDPKPAC